MTDEAKEGRSVSGEIVGGGERSRSVRARSDEGVDWSKLRGRGARAATIAYAGYKWFEDHADDVERFSHKAIERSKGKRIGRAVVPTAHVLIGAARWMQERGDDSRRRLPKGRRG